MKLFLYAAVAAFAVLVTPFVPAADAAQAPGSVPTSSGQQVQPCDSAG